MTKTYFYFVALKYVFYYLAFTYTWALINNPRAVVWYTLILISVILLSKRRYFPYLTKLVISDSCITKTLFGYEKINLKSENICVSQLRVYKTGFVVFHNQPREYVTLSEAVKLQKEGKAILYPYLPQMKIDYPALFEHVTFVTL